MHQHITQHTSSRSRRALLRGMAGSLAALTLRGMLPQRTLAAERAQRRGLHHEPRARRVIFLFMHGGPSQVDTFDYKPKLQQDDGKPLPFDAARNIDAKSQLLASPWKFQQHGESGLWVSELLPRTARMIDELCILRSVHSRGQSHGQAVSMLHTGSDNQVRPSVGSWVSYGLGTENPDLPTFVSLCPSSGHGGPRNYGSAFLPASHQATTIGKSGKLGDAQIRDLHSPVLSSAAQRRQLDLLQSMNRAHWESLHGDEQVAGMIDAFELAYRMQRVAPRVLDLSQETPETLALYGVGETATDNFGRQCLLARRFAEAGVRYIELSTGNVWDQHGNLKSGHEKNALATDRPIAGLLTDLRRRGLLEDTLVVWGGEFGRTPIVQGSNGRDHNPQGFTMWMAGGGVRGGMAYGNTDEYGYYAVEDRVHMHDIHATMLHLLGIDHTRLTFPYGGREFRLTDVAGEIVDRVLA